MEYSRLVSQLNRAIILFWFFVWFLISECETKKAELKKYTYCNDRIDMETDGIEQGELALSISDPQFTSTRASCDIQISAGAGRHLMFYFTDVFLGSPNISEARIDRACIEPKDVQGPYETNVEGMRSMICSKTEVNIGDKVYSTRGSALSIRFYRNRGYGITSYYKLVFTAFRSGSCRTTERRCSNERCIAHDIVCNGRNPCGDYSDCPTGLEHLSSWQMSGIVVLALLSGGIIIIMATVCLQRAGSKQYDMDDLPMPANGSVPTDHYHVEMSENVFKQPRKASSFKDHNSRPPSTGGTMMLNARNVDGDLFSRETSSGGDNQSSAGDREMLLKTHSKHSDDFDEIVMVSDRDSCITTLPFHDTGISSGYKKHEVNGSKSSMLLPSDCVQFTHIKPPATLVQSIKHSTEGLNVSSTSLLFSDSDSGADDTLEKSARKKKYLNQHNYPSMTSSVSHNGILSNGSHPFTAPPPPYGAFQNKPSALESCSISNERIVPH